MIVWNPVPVNAELMPPHCLLPAFAHSLPQGLQLAAAPLAQHLTRGGHPHSTARPQVSTFGSAALAGSCVQTLSPEHVDYQCVYLGSFVQHSVCDMVSSIHHTMISYAHHGVMPDD